MRGMDALWMRRSLALVWLLTAAVSLWELKGQSRDLLLAAGLTSQPWIGFLVCAGAAFDALLGLLLWCHPRRWVYLLALAGMLLMTLVASVLLPDLWLHPLGPLTKNIPMALALWLLWRDAR